MAVDVVEGFDAKMANLVRALTAIQYGSPIVIISYFFLASLISFLQLDNLKESKSPRFKRVVCAGLAFHAVLYAGQSGLVVDLIFTSPSIYGAEATNVHALSSVLVWIVITTSLLSIESCSWWPYYGSWLLSIATDILILAFSLSVNVPDTGAELALVSIQTLQILLLLLLTAIFFTWNATTFAGAHDEECRPLLDTAEVQDGNTCPSDVSQPNTSNQTSNSKAKDQSDSPVDDSDDDDDDVSDWFKREERKKAKMKKRLQEEGGWLAYLKSFSIFLPYIWPARSFVLKLHLLGVVLCMLCTRALNPLTPRQFGLLVDSLSVGDTVHTFRALGVYLLLSAASSNISILRRWLWLPIENNMEARMEKASYNHIMELSCDFHDSKRTGEVFMAMNQGQSVVSLIESIGFTLLPAVADLFIACVYFHSLFGSYMVLIGLATGISYVCVTTWTTGRWSNRRREMNMAWRQKSQIKYDTVGGWKTVSYFNRVPHSQDKYEGATDEANRLTLAYMRFWKLVSSFQGFLIDIGLFCACTLAVYDIIYRGKPLGSFVTLMNYWGNITGPLITLSSTSSDLIYDLIDAESLLLIWKKTSSVKDGPNEMNLEDGHVKFEDVSFKYASKKETIENLSFEAAPGQTIALVGETGAGKSTILKLLFRFYDVNTGSISIDGQDIRNVTLQSLRENIGVVPQDPTLFNVTIMDNLRYARLDATDDEIYDACKAAAVHDKIMTFTKGYSSKVGERGVKLSGGELQRVAIARAILKNPPIVLLDEATSSVDSETEAKIQDGLKRLCLNRTTFVVAHRLSTVQHADQILVLKDGKIVEKGSPSVLLQQKGKYYSLWAKQMGLFDPVAQKRESKSNNEGDDSSEGTQIGEGDLIDLRGDLKYTGEHKDRDADSGEIEAEVSSDSRLPHTQGVVLNQSVSESGAPQGQFIPEPDATSSTLPFRPDAPEFIPMDQASESKCRSSVGAGRSRTESSNSLADTRRMHELTRSDPGPSSSNVSSRPASSASGEPGLLALQQAAEMRNGGQA